MDSQHHPISERSSNIPPFLVMDVLERAMEMDGNIIHLEVGEPDFDTPPNIIEAGIAALRAGKTHYTASTGIPELRRAIADHYNRTYGVDVDPKDVVITSGSSPRYFLYWPLSWIRVPRLLCQIRITPAIPTSSGF